MINHDFMPAQIPCRKWRAVICCDEDKKARPTYATPPAEISDSVPAEEYSILSLKALVQMGLNSFNREDRVHLRDLLDVGLIDRSWLPHLLPEHATRLQQVIDDPDG